MHQSMLLITQHELGYSNMISCFPFPARILFTLSRLNSVLVYPLLTRRLPVALAEVINVAGVLLNTFSDNE